MIVTPCWAGAFPLWARVMMVNAVPTCRQMACKMEHHRANAPPSGRVFTRHHDNVHVSPRAHLGFNVTEMNDRPLQLLVPML
jgi:hypothetical protein